MARTRVLIAGAAGRDFHNFNLVYRDRPDYEVVAFTATQIPNIDGRRYPPELAGSLYPEGIPILPESALEQLVREHEIDSVVFAYSDVTHEHVMHVGSRALAAGASYRLISPRLTMLPSTKPVVAICAVRTGSGKSQTTRHVAGLLRESGKRVAVLRHPMPYGDLVAQSVQRFEHYEDLERADATIEEREEYEPHLAEGNLVFAGIDYAAILDRAEQEADVILWDGGNNDTPFIEPNLYVVVVDPHRPGHELRYHPGETNLRMADVCVVNKVDSAPQEGVDAVLHSIRTYNEDAKIVLAASPFQVEGDASAIAGKRVLAVEDGPTRDVRPGGDRRADARRRAGRERPRRNTHPGGMTTVIALGGNALMRENERGTAAEQLANLRRALPELSPLLEEPRVVVTHGNGPQVGNELLRQERAADEAPPLPLWLAVAQTQAEIGALIAAELRGLVDRPVACVVTHDGQLRGIEAVIDKDRASALLAAALGAERFVILTAADAVYRDFGGPDQASIDALRADDAEALLPELPEGSMRPKVEAAVS